MTRNPFRALREDNHLGSPEALSKIIPVSSQLIRFAEDGLYSHPPAKLVTALQEANLIQVPSLKALSTQYYAFQDDRRWNSYGALDDRVDLLDCLLSGSLTHPMMYWRITSKPRLSAHDCCRKFCFPINTFNEFENNRYNSVPISITNALITAGYTNSKVETLKEVYAVYRSAMNTAVGAFHD